MTRPFVCLLLASSVAACSADAHGTAPTIDMLTLDPAMVPVGGQSNVIGTVHFADPDGDVATVEIDIEPPTAQMLSTSAEIVGADGKTDGTTQFLLAVVPPEAGDYAVHVTVVDAEDNRSNELDGSFAAQ